MEEDESGSEEQADQIHVLQRTRVSFPQRVKNFVLRRRVPQPRVIHLPFPYKRRHYPKNEVNDHKYNFLTFFPLTLYNQFKYFSNMYFLGCALSQFIPALKVGFLFTFVAPLAFVVLLSMSKELVDDLKRWRQDLIQNRQHYERLTPKGRKRVNANSLKVGHLIVVPKNTRVPADILFMKSSEKSGTSFLRTDQLDGETDWKTRRSVSTTQGMEETELVSLRADVHAEAPRKEIYSFVGNLVLRPDTKPKTIPLSLENVMWSSTVVASGEVIGMVLYTGSDTRIAMNRLDKKYKRGHTEEEINNLTKVLFLILASLAVGLVAVSLFQGKWYISIVRFLILLSAIIPISMRVNLDLAKVVYSMFINYDSHIPGSSVRNSNLPEELGRINFLLSDKTGTLTQNVMTFRRLHFGISSITSDEVNDINHRLDTMNDGQLRFSATDERLMNCLQALALCHNVTPVPSEHGSPNYQASSPDEVALVKFTELIGITLVNRELNSMELQERTGRNRYEILHVFPFSSSTKRMGIVVRQPDGRVVFLMKGADVVMSRIVNTGLDWLQEECDAMAMDGLRTLVFAMKYLTEDELESFSNRIASARQHLADRDAKVQEAIESLEKDMDLLCVTGVEDRLQEDVRSSLELLRQAGIRVWMLTGDKVETATCIARSTSLVARNEEIFTLMAKEQDEALLALRDYQMMKKTALVIDGTSIQLLVDSIPKEFIKTLQKAPAVVCSRCSPTQKAKIVTCLRQYSPGVHSAAIGDGGNDVSMICEADVGIGIEGKEGKQASLAADFSITQFSHLTRLLLWHGRNSYKRSAALAQFIIHRGLIISFIQLIFSMVIFFAPIAIFQGMLLVGYSTYYTMFPVFSLILDEDISDRSAVQFPELYRDLQTGKVLNWRTFLVWLWKSILQGMTIMILCIIFFENNFNNIVSIAFTVLIFTELLNLAFTITVWNWIMITAEAFSFIVYILSIFLLSSYFNLRFVISIAFWWRVAVITLVAVLPINLLFLIVRFVRPPRYRKVDKRRFFNTGFCPNVTGKVSLKKMIPFVK